jgi:hypothetical protein
VLRKERKRQDGKNKATETEGKSKRRTSWREKFIKQGEEYKKGKRLRKKIINIIYA